MNINSIKPGSSTILTLNYLGMRKRCKNPWTTAMQVADFFPHVFRKNARAKGSDASTVLNRLADAGFVASTDINSVKHYAISPIGSGVPFAVAQRIRNSPYYTKVNNEED